MTEIESIKQKGFPLLSGLIRLEYCKNISMNYLKFRSKTQYLKKIDTFATQTKAIWQRI
jgi:hypothetical protein